MRNQQNRRGGRLAAAVVVLGFVAALAGGPAGAFSSASHTRAPVPPQPTGSSGGGAGPSTTVAGPSSTVTRPSSSTTTSSTTTRVPTPASSSTSTSTTRPAALLAPSATPVAVNDSYTTDENFTTPGTTLTVSAPGVLGNDLNVPAGGVAKLLSGPSNGTGSLSPSGALTYTPNKFFSGTDTFSYCIANTSGTCLSAAGSVIITVRFPSAAMKVSIAGPASTTIDVDVTYTVTVHNNGPSDATDARLIFYPGAFVTFVSAAAPAGWTCTTSGGATTCTAPMLASGVSATFAMVLHVDHNNPGGIDLQATADSQTPGTSDFTTFHTTVTPTTTTTTTTSTTTTSTTTTTIPSTTTTTIPSTTTTVVPRTTTTAAPSTTVPAPVTSVGPAQTPRPPAPVVPRPGALAFTGTDPYLPTLGGLLLVLSGVTMVRAGRRRRT